MSKPRFVSHAKLRARRLLHQVKNQRHLNVWRRFLFDNANNLHPNLDRAQALDHLDRQLICEV